MMKTIFIIGFLGIALQAQSYLYIWQGGVKTDSFVVTNNLKIDFRTTVIMNISCPGTPTVTYEGKTYNTVQIGTQCWLKENLNVGTRINGTQEPSNNGTIEKYCYEDNEAYCDTFGGLYQWKESLQYILTPGATGICPTGWHIPTRPEFEILAAAVNSDGNALKALGQGTGIGAGTNTSGFSALLSGYRESGGSFNSLAQLTEFWVSEASHFNQIMEQTLVLRYNSPNCELGIEYISYGLSVRCVKD